jgi:hypothetical protein
MGNLTDFHDDTIRPGMRTVLPAGDYVAQAIDFDFKPPKKDPNGQMAVVRFQIVNGPYRPRRILDRIILKYPKNPEAERLGRIRLQTFSHAAIGRAASDTSELQYKPVVLTVATRDDDKYGPQNEIRNYQPLPPGTPIDLRQDVVPGLPGEIVGLTSPAAGEAAAPPVDATGDDADAQVAAAMSKALQRTSKRTSVPVDAPPPTTSPLPKSHRRKVEKRQPPTK